MTDLIILVTKKIIWPTKKAALGVVTDFYVPIWVIGFCVPTYNIHGREWWLSAMNNKCFEIKKFVRNAFSSNLETQISRFFPSVNSKETQLLGKIAVQKSAWVKECPPSRITSGVKMGYHKISISLFNASLCYLHLNCK